MQSFLIRSFLNLHPRVTDFYSATHECTEACPLDSTGKPTRYWGCDPTLPAGGWLHYAGAQCLRPAQQQRPLIFIFSALSI